MEHETVVWQLGQAAFDEGVEVDLDRDHRAGGGSPAHAAQHVLAGQEVSFLQAGVHQRGDTAQQVGADRGGGGLVDDALEVLAGEASARHVADDRQDVEAAVADMLVAVAL